MTDTTREAVDRFDLDWHNNGMERHPQGDWVDYDDYATLLARAEAAEAERDAAVMAEREACHRVAVLTGESMAGEGRQKTVDAICAVIRARSNKGDG